MRRKIKGLTPKEHAIMELLTTGMLYKEIAVQKSISIDTVKKHCKNIYKKVNARNRVEAIINYHKTITV